MNVRKFPKIIITLLLLAITAGSIYFFAILPDTETLMAWFIAFGEFICRYDTLLIGALVAVNILELVDIIISAKRDEYINAHFEYATSKNISLANMFLHYFAGLFCHGPYIYSTEEQPYSLIRVIISFVTTVTKLLAWLVVVVTVVIMYGRTEIYEFVLGEGIDYVFTLVVLFAFLNCGVIVYALYRMLPLHEMRAYDVVSYYGDGSVTRRTEYSSNIIAILFIGGVIYLFESAYYIFFASTKIVRIIETMRFSAYLDEIPDRACILDYYGE
jgi:hypothetical protein